MFSLFGDILTSISDFFHSVANIITADILFIIALSVEALLVVFFLVKSAFSYEASLNRSLDRINYWLFEKKVVTEDNIKEINMLFKTKAPKRLCYYWQQYILFREGSPSTYLSVDNLVEKPLKTSSYNSNIKNLSLFSTLWAIFSALFIIVVYAAEAPAITGQVAIEALSVALFVSLIGLVFVVYLRARKNSVLNSLYQNVSLFGRFMDNACVDLPSYIDYQILFTPEEIEKGQPVLREFLDYKARKEKEEFNRAKEESVDYEVYDFSQTGVDGSLVLERALKESERYLKKKENILLKISQFESGLETRKKNFDNVQKEYQTKLQASKENISSLRQMIEQTTNRIESNYYRRQQTQEVGKQEQLEQEFESAKAKYLLEKNEVEEEIKKLNDELDKYKLDVQSAMLGEYQTFFNKFCHSAEKVVAKVFEEKLDSLKSENEKDKQYITELEIRLKNIPQGEYDANVDSSNAEEGKFDENGNYVYPNGTYYDKDGNFHDQNGNIYSQDGTLISKAEEKTKTEEKLEEKKIVDFDDFDTFDFMNDDSLKGEVYNVAEKVVNEIDKDNEIEIINNTEKMPLIQEPEEQEEPTKARETVEISAEDFNLEQKSEEKEEIKQEEYVVEEKVEETPKKKPGRPRKIVQEKKPAGKRGRPRKVVEEQKAVSKRKPGRPKKIVKIETEPQVKRGRGRPKKIETIEQLNKQLSEEEAKLKQIRSSLNQEIEQAVNGMDNKTNDKDVKREELMKEIEKLQTEAKSVIGKNDEDKIQELNAKLEELLQEIKKLS